MQANGLPLKEEGGPPSKASERYNMHLDSDVLRVNHCQPANKRHAHGSSHASRVSHLMCT